MKRVAMFRTLCFLFKFSKKHLCTAGVVSGLTTLAVILPQEPASAELRFCNQSDSQMLTAVGFKENGRWVSSGWYTIDPEDCRVVLSGNLRSRYYYAHAHTPSRAREWGNGYTFCVTNRAFNSLPDGNCSERTEEFSQVDTQNYTSYTWNFTCDSCDAENAQGFGLDGFDLPEGNLVRLCNNLPYQASVTATVSASGTRSVRASGIPLGECRFVSVGRATGRARISATASNGRSWTSSARIRGGSDDYTTFSFR